MRGHHETTLAEAVAAYIDMTSRKREAATAKGYRLALTMFLQHVGDIQLRHLSSAHVEAFFYGPKGILAEHKTSSGQVREAVSNPTFNNYRLRISAFLRHCVRKGWVKTDLLGEVDRATVETNVQRLRLKPHDLFRMLDLAGSARDRAYIATAQNTLKRASEIIALKVEDVDLDGGWVRIFNFKKKRWDNYPITQDLDLELRRWLTQYAIDIKRPLEKDDYLFPGRREAHFGGGRPRYYSWEPKNRLYRAERIIQRALAKMGYEELRGTGTHTIRRSVARAQFDRLAEGGGYANAMRIVMRMLDHKEQKTTEIYLGLDEDTVRRDDLMHGMPFMSALIPASDNVVPIRPVADLG